MLWIEALRQGLDTPGGATGQVDMEDIQQDWGGPTMCWEGHGPPRLQLRLLTSHTALISMPDQSLTADTSNATLIRYLVCATVVREGHSF